MSLGIWQIALIAVLVVLLFGRGRISDLMGDVARGITSFKKGLKEDDEQDRPASLSSDGDARTADGAQNTRRAETVER